MDRYESGYKVVWTEENKHYSVCVPNWDKYSYRIGEPMRRRTGSGPMCVFGGIPDAVDFRKGRFRPTHIHIHECEYIPSDGDKVWVSGGGVHATALLSDLSPGTILADEVVLGAKVEDVDYTLQGIETINGEEVI